jgi:cellulose synthase/poly-beta-1,6-N-acetylglucosamine synthase-like glycosyltransferase
MLFSSLPAVWSAARSAALIISLSSLDSLVASLAHVLASVREAASASVWAVVVLGVSIHALRTAIFLVGANIERRRYLRLQTATAPPDALPTAHKPLRVSVVVPARNEEENIERCVRSLAASQYPSGLWELIVVNDRSSDRTGEILRRLQTEFSMLIVHEITESSLANSQKNAQESAQDNIRTTNLNHPPTTNLQGKPRALHQGIERSSGDIVMMTDADCVIEPTWIANIVRVFEQAAAGEEVGLVPSFTVIQTFDGAAFTPFHKMQALEWIMNHTMASAGVGLKQPLGCFGNNLSIRRTVYDELGGYARIPFSVTEDLALLQAVAHTRWRIRYVCDRAAKVATLPCPDWLAFLKQHRRWALGGQALGWRAAFFVVSSAAMWLAMLVALLAGRWELFVLVAAARLVLDASVAVPSLVILDMKPLAWWLPVAVPFFLLVELIIPFFLLTPRVEWKGQILNARMRP